MLLSNHRRSVALSRSLVCALTALAVATASCSSMLQVPVVPTSAGQPIAWQAKAGDTVRVVLRDGGSAQFTVQRVTPDALIANDGTKFENAKITSVERRGFNSGKTAGAVAGMALVIRVAVYGALLSVFSGGTPD